MASQPVCPKCGGSGFLIVERAGISGASRCDCQAQGSAERREDRAEIPKLYRQASFDNFSIPEDAYYAQGLKLVMNLVRRYVEDFPNESRPGLLLIGRQGTGKTHLAVAALRRIIEKGWDCLFCDYKNLFDRIRSSYDANSHSADREAYREALEAPVLLLDDLGAHRVTDWVEDTVTSIITYRCNNRLPLIATTNLPDPDAGSAVMQRTELGQVEYQRTLADYIGARARSRLFEMCTVIRIPHDVDYRVRKARTF